MDKVINGTVNYDNVYCIVRFDSEIISMIARFGIPDQKLKVFMMKKPAVEIKISARFIFDIVACCIRHISCYLISCLIKQLNDTVVVYGFTKVHPYAEPVGGVFMVIAGVV